MHFAFFLLLFFEGPTSQILVVFLALMSAAVLFLVFFLALRFSVVKHSRKKLLYLFKRRKTNTIVFVMSSFEARVFIAERKSFFLGG